MSQPSCIGTNTSDVHQRTSLNSTQATNNQGSTITAIYLRSSWSGNNSHVAHSSSLSASSASSTSSASATSSASSNVSSGSTSKSTSTQTHSDDDFSEMPPLVDVDLNKKQFLSDDDLAPLPDSDSDSD